MWISTSELIEMGLSTATIYRQSIKGRWHSRPSANRTRRPQNEYLISSLPAELQLKIRAHRAETQQQIEQPITEASAAPASPDEKLDRLTAALARYSPPRYSIEERQAVERRCVQMAHLCDQAVAEMARLKKQRKLTRRSSANQAYRDYGPEIEALTKLAASSDPIYLNMYPSAATPPSTKTFLKLIKRYQAEGSVAFIREFQTIRSNDKRFKEPPPDAQQWLRDHLSSYVNASVTEFGRLWLDACRRNGWKVDFAEYQPNIIGSCYSWLNRWKHRVPASTMILVTRGQRGLENWSDYILRTTEDLRPRVGWTMDWKIFDAMYWKPGDSSGRPPKLTREWLCPAYDIASHAAFGYFIDDRPNARGISLAYLDAIGQTLGGQPLDADMAMLCGIQRSNNPELPAFMLWDNGKDFRSYLVEGRPIQVTVANSFNADPDLQNLLLTYSVGLAPEMKLRVRHAKPFNAKSKTVERWFKQVGEYEKGLPGYCGNKPEHKPHFFDAARRIHEAFGKRQHGRSADLKQLPLVWLETYEQYKEKYGYGTPFLAEADFKLRFREWVINYLHEPRKVLCDDVGLLSPIEFLNNYADAPHLLTGASTSALLLAHKKITVDRNQVIAQWGGEKFHYREVTSELSDGSALLRLPLKAQAEFRYHPNNVGRALIVMGAPVCWVEEPNLLGYGAREEDFKLAGRAKKQRDQVAREFFQNQGPAPDWKDEAIERRNANVVELKRVVNGPDVEGRTAGFGLPTSGDDDGSPAPKSGATITALTRFDRKTEGGGRGRLRAAPDSAGRMPGDSPAPNGDDDDWDEGLDDLIDQTISSDDDDWIEPWE